MIIIFRGFVNNKIYYFSIISVTMLLFLLLYTVSCVQCYCTQDTVYSILCTVTLFFGVGQKLNIDQLRIYHVYYTYGWGKLYEDFSGNNNDYNMETYHVSKKEIVKEMAYEVLVLDIDGTLTNSKKEISEKTLEAVINAQKEGIKVVIASGRPTAGIKEIAKKVKLDEYGGYVLSYNGGKITNFKTKEVIYNG